MCRFNARSPSTRPSVNISENEKEFDIEMAVPGFKKEDFKINLEKSVLTVSLAKSEKKKEESKRYSKREFYFETFSSSFTLPENVDEEKVSAEYIDGILKVSISKKEEEIEKVRVIDV